MQNGKIRYEIIIGLILLAATIASILISYIKVTSDISLLDLWRIDIKAIMHGYTTMLTLLSLASLFAGAVAGYLIGKYAH